MTDLEMVKQGGWNIGYIQNPSLEVQLAAVNQNVGTLQFTTQEFKDLYPEYFL